MVRCLFASTFGLVYAHPENVSVWLFQLKVTIFCGILCCFWYLNNSYDILYFHLLNLHYYYIYSTCNYISHMSSMQISIFLLALNFCLRNHFSRWKDNKIESFHEESFGIYIHKATASINPTFWVIGHILIIWSSDVLPAIVADVFKAGKSNINYITLLHCSKLSAENQPKQPAANIYLKEFQQLQQHLLGFAL